MFNYDYQYLVRTTLSDRLARARADALVAHTRRSAPRTRQGGSASRWRPGR